MEPPFPTPPGRMPLLRGGRPRKSWRYIGAYGPELMLCAGDALIGPFRRRWWAVAFPDGMLVEGTRVQIDGPVVTIPGVGRVEVQEVEPVETLSPHGAQWIWTAKQADVRVVGSLDVAGRRHDVDARGVVDDSAGYHARHTAWKWSAGVGVAADGRSLGWNLVTGVHDDPEASERTLWVDGVPRQLPPLEFADDLSAVGELRFREWATREENVNLLLLRNRYRQPFGEFSGSIDGIELARGWGVMEEHDVRW